MSSRASSLLRIVSLLSWVTPAVGPAHAQSELIDSAFSNCTTINCSTTSVAGWVGSSSRQVLPWTAKFLAVEGNCLRIQMNLIRDPTADLKITIVAPNGRTRYRDDESGTCANCPMVQIDPVPVSGFYTAVVSSANGAPADTDFHLRFGQYPHGNPNCDKPTAAIR